MTDLKRTPLYDRHLAAGARMVPFAGWEMPVQYQGVIAEHTAVREGVGVFDVSHMGEVFFEGPDAAASVDYLVCNRIAGAEDGQAVYGGLLNPQGGFVDDVVVYRYSAEKVLVVVNAANREKDFAHMQAHHRGQAALREESDAWAQLAVQGPKAQAALQPLTEAALDGIGKFRFLETRVAGQPCLLARTGYTGEDGFEIYCAPEAAGPVWDAVVAAGAVPCGLGARDTLRLEAKFPLYGNDIDDDHTPYEANLGWIVKLDKGEFVGRDALASQKETGIPRKLVAFKLTGRGIPRPGMALLDEGGQPVGEVTSGTMSPTLKEAIGVGYVPTSLARSGTSLQVDVRGRAVPAVVVKPPFVQK